MTSSRFSEKLWYEELEDPEEVRRAMEGKTVDEWLQMVGEDARSNKEG